MKPSRSQPLRYVAAGVGALALSIAGLAAPPASAVASAAASGAVSAKPAPNALSISTLEVENQAEPLGIDVAAPRFSWVLDSEQRDQRQTAYEIEVASSAAKLGGGESDVWDTGKRAGEKSFGIPYDGDDLAPATAYHWRVRVWDRDGKATGWSKPSTFETGLLSTADWAGARWISPASDAAGGSYLRGSVHVPTEVVAARLYVAGRGNFERGPDGQGICCEQNFGLARGIYEATLNGEHVGDERLQSEPVDTRVRALYRTYDVTDLVRRGGNALGLQIGEDSDVLALVRVTTSDGKTVILATGDDWQTHAGPVTRANRFNGETYDARREVAGWDEPDFDTSSWTAAKVAAGELGTLTSAQFEPMRVTKSHKATEITNPAEGVYVFDFGTNMSGWTRLHADLPAGTTVTIKHGERVSNGRVDNGIIGAAQTSTYTAGEDGSVDWEPRFVYAGFRWVEVSGLPAAPDAKTLVAQEIHNDVARAGRFDSSDPLLNRLHTANVQTQLNGLHGIPEDTPTREKRGWMADAHIAAEALINNHDMQSFYEKFVRDMGDAQRPDGQVPDIVPIEPTDAWQNRSDPAWAAATVLLPAYLHRAYGDDRAVSEHYHSMRRWIAYVETTTDGGLVTRPSQQWGQDWLAIESTDGTLFRSAFFFWALEQMADNATRLGHDEDATSYEARAVEVRDAINARFFDEIEATYGPSQFGNAFPLLLGIVPEGREKDVLATLVSKVRAKDNHFTGGLPGIKYIPEALAAYGRSDVVLDVVRKTDYPGWGWMLENGPGTIWEDWQGASSLNHPMFTSIDTFLYDRVAGIGQAPESNGYETLRISPELHDEMDEAAATLGTPRGKASTHWFHRDGALVQQVVVPVGSTAEVTVPGADVESVLEGTGKALGHALDADGVHGVEAAGKDAVVTLGSGSYELTVDKTAGALRRAGHGLDSVGTVIADLAASRDLTTAGRLRLSAARIAANTSVNLAIRLRLRGSTTASDAATVAALKLTNVLASTAASEQRRGALSEAGYAKLRPAIDAVARTLSPEVSRATGVKVTATPAGTLLPGEKATVEVRVENTGRTAVTPTRIALDPPDGWSAKTVTALPTSIAAGATATAEVELQVSREQDLGPVVIPGTVSYEVLGIDVDHPVVVEAEVEAPVRLGQLSVSPRVVTALESTALAVELTNVSRSQDASVALRPVSLPDGWTLSDDREFTVPAAGSTNASLTLTASEAAGAGGNVVLDAYSGDELVGRLKGEVYLRGPGCAADSSGEACLPAGMDLVYNFESGTDGWTAGEGTASVEHVRSIANGPGAPRLGVGAIEAAPESGLSADAWRAVQVTPKAPLEVGDATSLIAYVNGYGGGGAGATFEARIRVTGEGAEPYETTTQITPNLWSKLDVDMRAWDATVITGIEISFRGSWSGGWGGRFQVDQVALDRAPAPPAQADNLAAGRPVTAKRTLSCCGWAAANLTDGVRVSTASSKGYTSDPWNTTPTAEEWVSVDLGETVDLGSVWLYPRTEVTGDGAGTSGANFPLDFTIQTSADGSTWRTVRSLVGQATDGTRGLGYEIEGTGRYVRVLTSTLGRPSPDESGSGYHRLQLAEIEVYGASAGE